LARFAVGVAIVVIAAIALLTWGMKRYGVFSLAEVDDADLTQRYRLVCGAWPDLELDAAHVPPELHLLLPYARKYGYGNPLIVEDCARRMDAKEAAQLVWEIDRNRAAIDRWIERSHAIAHTNEVSAFVALLALRRVLRPITVSSEATG